MNNLYRIFFNNEIDYIISNSIKDAIDRWKYFKYLDAPANMDREDPDFIEYLASGDNLILDGIIK